MNENAARLDWAGAGVRVPRRFVSPRVAAPGGRAGLGEPRSARGPREMADWASTIASHSWELAASRALVETARVRAERELRGWDSNPQPLG